MKEYEFDFANSLGDTIMEKFESLYLILYEVHRETPIRMVIGSPDIITLFEIKYNFMPPTITAMLGYVEFAGRFGNGTGNGQMNFQCFKSSQVAKNELFLFGEHGNSLIKFKNYEI